MSLKQNRKEFLREIPEIEKEFKLFHDGFMIEHKNPGPKLNKELTELMEG